MFQSHIRQVQPNLLLVGIPPINPPFLPVPIPTNFCPWDDPKLTATSTVRDPNKNCNGTGSRRMRHVQSLATSPKRPPQVTPPSRKKTTFFSRSWAVSWPFARASSCVCLLLRYQRPGPTSTVRYEKFVCIPSSGQPPHGGGGWKKSPRSSTPRLQLAQIPRHSVHVPFLLPSHNHQT